MGYTTTGTGAQHVGEGVMTTAAEQGRKIAELAALMERTPEFESALADRIEAIKAVMIYETAATAEDAMAMLVNGMSEADLLAMAYWDDREAAAYQNRIEMCLYGVMEFLEKTAGISRDDFGGNYLLMRGENEPRRRLGVTA